MNMKSKKKIAVIGANQPLLSFFKRAVAYEEYEYHVFSWDEGAVCKTYAHKFYPISFKEKDKILDICKEINIDGITSFSLESALPTVNYIAQKLGLQGNSPECGVLMDNKYTMRNALLDNSVAVPRFKSVSHADEVSSDFNYPLIIKPIDSGGSRGVTLVYDKNELANAITIAIKFSQKNEVLVEEFIDGKEYSVEYLTDKSKHYFIAITEKETTQPPYFVELAHHQPALLDALTLSKVKQTVEKTLSVLKVAASPSHTEIKINSKGEIFVIETCSRLGGDFITSDLVYYSTGIDMVKAAIDLCANNYTYAPPAFNKFSGIYFLSLENKRILNVFDHLPQHSEIVYSEKNENELKNVTESNERSGCLIYQSEKRMTY